MQFIVCRISQIGGIDIFKNLVAKNNPVIPNEEIRRAVNSILSEGGKYWNSASDSKLLSIAKDGQEAKKAYEEAIGKYLLMQKIIAKIVDIWPQGRELVKEIQEMAGLGMGMAENDYNCGKYIHAENSENPEYYSRSRGFEERRHQFGDMVDKKQLHIQKMLISSKINKE